MLSPGRWRHATNRFLLLVFGLTVAVFAIELGYRVYLLMVRPPVVLTPDGEEFNPNGQGRWRGGKISIDEHGFRNGLDSSAMMRNRRILVIGDSIAFGMGVNDDAVFTHRLNQKFAPASIGFVNLSRPGWDTPTLRDLLYRFGEDFLPIYSLLWVYYINDAKSSTVYRVPPTMQREREQYNFSGRFQWTVYSGLRWPFLFKPRVKAYLKKQDPRRTSWEAYYKWCLDSYAPRSETRRNEELYLWDVVQWSKSHNAKLWVAIAPAADQFIDGHLEPQVFIKEVMALQNVPVLDLLPFLRAANQDQSVFLPNDQAHWNSWGHRMVADAIEKWFTSNKLLPAMENPQ